MSDQSKQPNIHALHKQLTGSSSSAPALAVLAALAAPALAALDAPATLVPIPIPTVPTIGSSRGVKSSTTPVQSASSRSSLLQSPYARPPTQRVVPVEPTPKVSEPSPAAEHLTQVTRSVNPRWLVVAILDIIHKMVPQGALVEIVKALDPKASCLGANVRAACAIVGSAAILEGAIKVGDGDSDAFSKAFQEMSASITASAKQAADENGKNPNTTAYLAVGANSFAKETGLDWIRAMFREIMNASRVAGSSKDAVTSKMNMVLSEVVKWLLQMAFRHGVRTTPYTAMDRQSFLTYVPMTMFLIYAHYSYMRECAGSNTLAIDNATKKCVCALMLYLQLTIAIFPGVCAVRASPTPAVDDQEASGLTIS